MHHPPLSSGKEHGSSEWMQWPYEEWGADAVLAGHDHVYERIVRDGLVYFTNGLGGAAIYKFDEPIRGSRARYDDDHGAMLVDARAGEITFQFVTHDNDVVDNYDLSKNCG